MYAKTILTLRKYDNDTMKQIYCDEVHAEHLSMHGYETVALFSVEGKQLEDLLQARTVGGWFIVEAELRYELNQVQTTPKSIPLFKDHRMLISNLEFVGGTTIKSYSTVCKVQLETAK